MKLTDVSVGYGQKIIVKNINLNFEPGKIYGIIGKNGTGKTTLMKAILGLIDTKSGTIEKEDTIGALIEEPGLFKDRSGFDNLKIKAIMEGADYSEINNLLDAVGLKHAAKRKVKSYSLGMRQRLGIAMAIIGKPKVLILDEPINGLDPEGIKDMRNLFLNLKEKYNMCIIISSHILEELEKVCDDFIFMNEGKVVSFKTKEELHEDLVNCTIIKLDRTDGVLPVLTDLKIQKYNLENNIVKIFGDEIDTSDVIECLVKNNYKVSEAYKNRITCEEYFFKMIG
ncbi:ATP-binding cassette domain-containing protein [Lachnobacterium bovis]|uniref:ABC-2 type transport system ATP-binding protein n=1 Tax=Lachnobacterium bovis TaxID=140626 RepID=A0A1H9SP19_9FIRM|nr:ATP-binding cassette domain-containing protein [Lachnobacterium bovis]SER86657.1 ABC-2 type transport system ATP-binding protein [Lachnobacterium bovis]